MKQHLSLRRAALQMGVHHTTLARAVQRGLLRPSMTTPGGQPRFSPEAVASFARSLRPALLARTGPRQAASAFRQAALLLTSELRPDAVLQRLAVQARRLVAARYAALAVMDEDGHVRQFFTAGLTAPQRRALGALPQGKGLLGVLFRSGKALRVPDIAQHPACAGFPPNHPPMRSLLGVPILSRGRTIGNLYLADKIGTLEFTAADQRLIEDLARHAALAIHNAQLYQSATRQASQWQALTSIFGTITSSLDPRTVLRLVVKEARRLLQVDVAFIALLHPVRQELRITAWSGLRSRGMHRLHFAQHRGLGGAALASGRLVAVEDYHRTERIAAPLSQEVGEEGLISQVAAPLETRGQQLGVLYVGMRAHRSFSKEEMDLVSQMARLAALALDNARLYAAEQAAHEKTARAEANLQAVMEHLPESAFVVNPQRRVMLANRAASAVLLGAEGRRLLGRRHPFGLRFFHTDGRSMAYGDTPVGRCLTGRGPCLGQELVIERPDGVRLPLLVSAAAIPGPQGGMSGVVAVQQDISHLKEVEQMKDDFLSMITHDLKSPLTTIKGLASSVLMDTAPGSVTVPLEWAKTIDAETDRLNGLVDNLLDMSRIEAGVMPLEREECYLIELVRESIEHLRYTASFGDHPVRIEVPTDLPPAFADYTQIQRVVTNLLSNAAKYSEPDAEITVRALHRREDSQLEVSVEDHGLGIPASELHKVFAKFYRSPHTLQGRRKGSGLGLAICNAIVQAHGGAIWARSRPGVGSIFTFTLPAAEESQ